MNRENDSGKITMAEKKHRLNLESCQNMIKCWKNTHFSNALNFLGLGVFGDAAHKTCHISFYSDRQEP